MSYTKNIYHIVFRTKYSKRTIDEAHEKELYAYALGFIREKGGHLYRIGGMPDHVHLLVSIPPTIAIADFVRDLKITTSKYLRHHVDFPNFEGWADKYAALTYSERDIHTIYHYIANQKEHHKQVSFADEFRKMLIENGITIDEKYFLQD